jgi:HSP20 family protein
MTEEKGKAARHLTRWDPFEELDPGVDWFFRRRGGPSIRRAFGEPGMQEGVAPAVDIAEDDERYVITVEMPGAEKEDVTVEAHDDVLTIRGEKRSEREEKREQSRYVERRYGSFSRSFTLPANAARDGVSASFSQGVLTVEVPKVEEPKPKIVSIKS